MYIAIEYYQSLLYILYKINVFPRNYTNWNQNENKAEKLNKKSKYKRNQEYQVEFSTNVRIVKYFLC